jgi:hypothetical protein
MWKNGKSSGALGSSANRDTSKLFKRKVIVVFFLSRYQPALKRVRQTSKSTLIDESKIVYVEKSNFFPSSVVVFPSSRTQNLSGKIKEVENQTNEKSQDSRNRIHWNLSYLIMSMLSSEKEDN